MRDAGGVRDGLGRERGTEKEECKEEFDQV
jgi:hypothetical protein